MRVPAGPGGKRLRDMPEYKVWKEMIRRCHDATNKCFKNYGARGITVCPAWRASFDAFYRDMGPRPEGTGAAGRALYSIEREDNFKGYESGNCVWATQDVQANNRRAKPVALHPIEGEQLTRLQALAKAGVTGEAVRARMRRGMTFEQAILVKRDPRGRPKKAS
jgi:hypothetical protein